MECAFIRGFTKAATAAGLTEQEGTELAKVAFNPISLVSKGLAGAKKLAPKLLGRSSAIPPVIGAAAPKVSNKTLLALLGGTSLAAGAGGGAVGAMAGSSAAQSAYGPSMPGETGTPAPAGPSITDQLQGYLDKTKGFLTDNPVASPVGLGLAGAGLGAAMTGDEEDDDSVLNALLGGTVGVGGGLALNHLLQNAGKK